MYLILQVIIISDRVCRTMTYLSAIAFGFPRINFAWILNSISSKNLLPMKNYALQVGFSALKNRDIEPHEHPSNLRGLFADEHFVVASVDHSFTDDWKKLLTRLGAEVTVKNAGKLNRLKKFTVIISEANSCPQSIKIDAQEKDKFLVNTKW